MSRKKLIRKTALKKSEIVPVELDSNAQIGMEIDEQAILAYINACVQHFTNELKRNVNEKGYDIDVKVDVMFGGKK